MKGFCLWRAAAVPGTPQVVQVLLGWTAERTAKVTTAGRAALGNSVCCSWFLTLLLGQQTEKMEESVPSFPQIMQRFFFCEHKFLCAGFLLILFSPLYSLSQDFLWVCFALKPPVLELLFWNYSWSLKITFPNLYFAAFPSPSCCFITPPVWLVMVPAVLFCLQGQPGQGLTCLVLTESTE